jgi:hypothetical protein
MYDLFMTCKIVCMDSRALKSLAILNTLKVLISLNVLKVFRFVYPLLYVITTYEYIISKTDKRTTIPSSKFILSEQYFFIPKAIILESIS